MAANYDLIFRFFYEEREMTGEWNSVGVGHQDSEWIFPHEREGGGTIFLAVEFWYVHFWVSEFWTRNAGQAPTPHV